MEFRVNNRKKFNESKQYSLILNLVPRHYWHERWRTCQS